MRIRFLAGLALAVISCSAEAQTVSAETVQKMLAGKRVSLTCVDGTSGTGRYINGRGFGTIRGTYRVAGGLPMQDTGRVRGQGNQLCLAFPMLTGNQERCFGVVQRAADRFSFTTFGVGICEVRAG